MSGNSYTEIVEDTIDGFDIYIEPNPDQYRGGFVWSVSKEDAELDSGVVFSINDALIEAVKNIHNLTRKFKRAPHHRLIQDH